MSNFFNDKRIEAMLTQNYICPECGAKMTWETEWEDILVCESCGFSMDSDMYGFDSEEEYQALYPTLEEVLALEGEYEDDDGEEDED